MENNQESYWKNGICRNTNFNYFIKETLTSDPYQILNA